MLLRTRYEEFTEHDVDKLAFVSNTYQLHLPILAKSPPNGTMATFLGSA
jgi:hypothetical protein